jgi:hypothetical protein
MALFEERQSAECTLKDCIDIFDLMKNNYWLNFHENNKEGFKRVMEIKTYFNVIKNTKYVQYKNEIYKKHDPRLGVKMRGLAEIYCQIFRKEDQEARIKDRILLRKLEDYIEAIMMWDKLKGI